MFELIHLRKILHRNVLIELRISVIVKTFSEHNILSGIFIPLTNYCDLPVLNQVSLFFHRENLNSPGFENSRLTGLRMSSITGFIHSKNGLYEQSLSQRRSQRPHIAAFQRLKNLGDKPYCQALTITLYA